jgi:hypothetical protein
MQEEPKERRTMNEVVDYEAPNVFYRADKGGETVP